jgi:hypothetical protein
MAARQLQEMEKLRKQRYNVGTYMLPSSLDPLLSELRLHSIICQQPAVLALETTDFLL